MKIEITDNVETQRFEAHVDGQPAGFVEYRVRDRQIALVHTQVEDAFEGKGVASTMVKGALGRVAESGMELLPVCPFVASYVTKHAEYQGLVPAQRRARYGLPEAAGSS
ncbi:hypothetical protein BH24ACT9_BH24ACT9_11210 [soil metagenome]